jgi:hypothetical protein
VIGRLTGLAATQHHRAIQLSFVPEPHNFVTPPPRRIALFAFGDELFLAVLIWILRGLDRRCGTQLEPLRLVLPVRECAGAEPAEVWVNVCVRCGSGHSEPYLRKTRRYAKWRVCFRPTDARRAEDSTSCRPSSHRGRDDLTQFFGREDDRIALNVVVLFHRCPAWGDLSPEITPQAR